MSDSRKHRWIFLLIAIGSLIAANEALAQSTSAASKQSFATLLTRSATAAPVAAAAAVAPGPVATATTATNQVTAAASAKPCTPTCCFGVCPATRCVPPCKPVPPCKKR
jgi:hypothetical protein